MHQFYQHLNILTMPTDACNLKCVYCFHGDDHSNQTTMSLETVEKIIKLTESKYRRINFLWHGGEPLIMGLDFYKDVLKIQQKATCKIQNSMQSNLTLMTPDLADFFCENEFKLSGSFDGVCNSTLRGNDEKILRGRQLIIDRKKKCGFIMVLSKANVHTLIDSYNYFKSINTNYSLNLYVDSRGNENPSLKLEKEETIAYLKEFFLFWANDKDGNIRISYFQNVLEFILFKNKMVCTYNSCLGRWIGLRHDGEIVPCNRRFPKRYSYGNVHEYSCITEVFNSNGFTSILNDAITRREACSSCQIYDFCNGGCNHVAYTENGENCSTSPNCKILIEVYTFIDDYLQTKINHLEEVNNPMLKRMLSKHTKENLREESSY